MIRKVTPHTKLYEDLKILDERCFPNCGNEFLPNRDWWVIVHNGKIRAYCGCSYSMGVCVFVRAWVQREYRGQGWQKKMIKCRIRAAKIKRSYAIVTYTIPDNFPSANSLIKCGFLLHEPEYAYAGRDMMYFIKRLI